MSCRIRRTQMMAQASLPEKSVDPKMKADLDNKLAQMQAERSRQDAMWTANIKEIPSDVSNMKNTSTNETAKK